MSESLRQRHEALQVEEALATYPGLRIVPSRNGHLTLRGALDFRATGPTGEEIADTYDVELRIPSGFPAARPDAWETGGRISPDYHTLDDGQLCLGAPTEIRLKLKTNPTLLGFINVLVVPYLYGHAFFLKHGTMPFGELDHGIAGLRQHLATMFGAHSGERPEEFLRLAGMKKREANTRPCPCGSGRRLGRCHNRSVNGQRRRMGRLWFRAEYARVIEHFENLESPRRRRRPFEALGR
jgi:hypothetical protein